MLEEEVYGSAMDRYPFSELGMYIKHAKVTTGDDNGRSIAESNMMPKFIVNCSILGKKTTMANARELYYGARMNTRIHICAEKCNQQCFMN